MRLRKINLFLASLDVFEIYLVLEVDATDSGGEISSPLRIFCETSKLIQPATYEHSLEELKMK